MDFKAGSGIWRAGPLKGGALLLALASQGDPNPRVSRRISSRHHGQFRSNGRDAAQEAENHSGERQTERPAVSPPAGLSLTVLRTRQISLPRQFPWRLIVALAIVQLEIYRPSNWQLAFRPMEAVAMTSLTAAGICSRNTTTCPRRFAKSQMTGFIPCKYLPCHPR